MSDRFKTDEEIVMWLEREYTESFSGWDFSYIENRRIPLGQLPWDYVALVHPYVSKADSMLDLDTGGGEILAKILAATTSIRTINALFRENCKAHSW